jgi:hypothetical protein
VLCGLVLALAVSALYVATSPKEPEGLLWGGHVYTTKQEFNGYLKSKGLSYKTWLARNPGAAPWEPAVERRAAAADGDGSVSPVLPALFGLLLGVFCSLLLLGRRSRDTIAGLVTGLATRSPHRLDGAVRVDADGGALHARRVSAGNLAFSLVVTATAGMFLFFVVVLATS